MSGAEASPISARSISHLPCLPGHFHYADLGTSDVDGACAFYAELLGWTLEEMPGVPNRYLSASIDGREKAAIAGMPSEQMEAATTARWMPYLWVTDLDAIVGKIAPLGGEVVKGPMAVFDMGHMAIAADDTGAAFGLWQDAKPGETVVKGEHGSPFWYELHSTDVDASKSFYGSLVGWKTESLQMTEEFTYDLIEPEQTDELQRNAGGIMSRMQAHRDAGEPSSWYVYFNVNDCDAAYAKALTLGAASVMEPHDIPGAGRSCWVMDPQGAQLALMTPNPRQS